MVKLINLDWYFCGTNKDFCRQILILEYSGLHASIEGVGSYVNLA